MTEDGCATRATPGHPVNALNAAQRAVVEFWQGYGVPAEWFESMRPDGTAAVIAVGETFVWSFTISPDGEAYAASEMSGEWTTGVTI